MTNTYSSGELFHFVGHASPNDDRANYDKLGSVLNSNCVSHFPHDGTWGKVSYITTWDNRIETEQLIVPDVTCYADIPFDALSVHVSKYGRFGISFSTWLLIKHGARPVMYIPMRSDDWQSINGLNLLRDIEAILKGFNEHVTEKQKEKTFACRKLGTTPSTSEEAVSAIQNMLLKDFLAFVKPYNSELLHTHPNNFYMEREWRKYGNMKFTMDQVSRVVVAKGYKEQTVNDFPEYEDRIFGI